MTELPFKSHLKTKWVQARSQGEAWWGSCLTYDIGSWIIASPEILCISPLRQFSVVFLDIIFLTFTNFACDIKPYDNLLKSLNATNFSKMAAYTEKPTKFQGSTPCPWPQASSWKLNHWTLSGHPPSAMLTLLTYKLPHQQFASNFGPEWVNYRE